MAPKRLFIIDAMAMAFRNFHAFGARPISTADGLPTSAIFGSAQFLMKIIREENPDYIVIATDSREPTFRHELYKEYKANRSAMPEDLATQIPYLFEMFDALNCPVLKQPGLEADDLIGSLVKKYSGPETNCYIVSGDKDFMQLIDEHTFLYSPKKGGLVNLIGTEGVKEKFGCHPSQVIDLLALMGDSADNVPGVPGIGEKGAAKLIEAYGSLDKIYENLEDIKNKRQKTGLSENKDKAYLSQELVTIKCDYEKIPNLEDMVCHQATAMANENLLAFFKKMEFRRLTEIVATALNPDKAAEGSKVSPAPTKTKSSSQESSPEDEDGSLLFQRNDNYHLINNKAKLGQLIAELAKVDHFAFDTETTGLNIVNDHPIGISIAYAENQAFYIPIVEQHLDGISADEVITALTPIFGDASKTKIAHNLKFDLQMLDNINIKVSAPFADTMMASYLLNSVSKSHSLDATCLNLFNFKKIPTSDLIGKKGEISMLDIPLFKLSYYACEDADYCLRIYKYFMPLLSEKKLSSIFNDIEMPLVPILASMEKSGVFVDQAFLKTLSTQIAKRIDEVEVEVFKLAGEEFNIKSTKQLAVILFDKLKVHEEVGVKRLKKTKTGFSTDVSVLEKLSAHPLPKILLEYRMLTKLKSTYVDTLPELINTSTHRLHTSFHQTGTATGRLSSSAPNLQNIPVRSPLGREIRKSFRAKDSDHVIISADYSQVELRLLAHLANDEKLKEAFTSGTDVHTATAAKIFDIAVADVDRDTRGKAKAINFGIIYGMGANRLAQQTGVSNKEAKEFIEKYFEGYPNVKKFIQDSIEQARATESTKTITGRIRPLSEINSTNKMSQVNAENIAVNSPIQGSAADLVKQAMIRVDADLAKNNLHAKMLLQVHDELIFECPKNELEKTKNVIKSSMENAMVLDVPLIVDIGAGENWLEAH